MNKNYILIVEDEEFNFELLKLFLKELDYSLIRAENAQEAFKFISLKNPVLILLDINLPEVSGYEIIKILKRNRYTKEIPVIFVSSLDKKIEIDRGFELGAIDYITKPFQKKHLLDSIRNLNL